LFIVATSVGGSYLAIRATAYWLGGWLPVGEFVKWANSKNRKIYSIPNKWWYYFAGFIVIAIAGAIYQFKYHGTDKKEEDGDGVEMRQDKSVARFEQF
jgi:hypothetical protein